MNDKVYCKKCDKISEYYKKDIIEEYIIDGIKIKYDCIKGICKECGSEVFIREIEDGNKRRLNDAYRESLGVISIKEIQEILNKYNIGATVLSKILGWGEITITRYLNGQTPSEVYSNKLKKINSEPKVLLELLEKGKKNISNIAYEKCKNNILAELDISISNKIDSVVIYILSKLELTPLALQKLLYYSQGFHRVFNDQYLFNDDCEAWVHGPVYRDIYCKYKNNGYNPIDEDVKYENINLTINEKETIDSVIMNLGCYSGKILERMTHIEAPWKVTRGILDHHEVCNRVISKELINDYFSKAKNKYNMMNIMDIKDYSSDMFSKISRI